MSTPSAALVEGVAQALTWAMQDPSGHASWNTSVGHNLSFSSSLSCKRPRAQREATSAAAVFDSSAIPPIAIDKYLIRLSATFRCSDATFIAALIVVDRLLGYEGGRLPLTPRNVHRVFLASLVVAVKYHEDQVYSNNHYARGGGVHLKEVNRLERVLLASLDFDLRISPEHYCFYEANLLSLCNTLSPKDMPLGLPCPGSAASSAAATRDATPVEMACASSCAAASTGVPVGSTTVDNPVAETATDSATADGGIEPGVGTPGTAFDSGAALGGGAAGGDEGDGRGEVSEATVEAASVQPGEARVAMQERKPGRSSAGSGSGGEGRGQCHGSGGEQRGRGGRRGGGGQGPQAVASRESEQRAQRAQQGAARWQRRR
mmetsp:Transcript_74858/g.243123  ORF Transcript_74858/g.243123 Transcript_74858/m.243123 type:complete len:376 (-) Transcript_74858:55-1182(-)